MEKKGFIMYFVNHKGLINFKIELELFHKAHYGWHSCFIMSFWKYTFRIGYCG